MNDMRKLMEAVDLNEDDYARMQHGPEDYLDGQRFVGEEADMNLAAEIEEHLMEAQESLLTAIEHLQDAARLSGVAGFSNPIEGQLRSYTIPHLHRWVKDGNQPGSIASVYAMLEDEQE